MIDTLIKLTRTVYELAMNPTTTISVYHSCESAATKWGKFNSRYVDLILNSCINYSTRIKLLSIVLPDCVHIVQGF